MIEKLTKLEPILTIEVTFLNLTVIMVTFNEYSRYCKLKTFFFSTSSHV